MQLEGVARRCGWDVQLRGAAGGLAGRCSQEMQLRGVAGPGGCTCTSLRSIHNLIEAKKPPTSELAENFALSIINPPSVCQSWVGLYPPPPMFLNMHPIGLVVILAACAVE